MLKKLVRHGNTFAIPIDKKIIQEALLNPDTLFDVQILPGGGLAIQSVEEIDRKKTKQEFEELTEKYDQLFKNLADR